MARERERVDSDWEKISGWRQNAADSAKHKKIISLLADVCSSVCVLFQQDNEKDTDSYLELDGWRLKVCRRAIRACVRSGTRCHSWHNRRRNWGREGGREKWSRGSTLQLVFSTGGFALLLSPSLTNNLHRGLSVKTRRSSWGLFLGLCVPWLGSGQMGTCLSQSSTRSDGNGSWKDFPRLPLSTLKASLPTLRRSDRWEMSRADVLSSTAVSETLAERLASAQLLSVRWPW